MGLTQVIPLDLTILVVLTITCSLMLGLAVKELCGTDNQTYIILALTTITLCNVTTCKKTNISVKI